MKGQDFQPKRRTTVQQASSDIMLPFSADVQISLLVGILPRPRPSALSPDRLRKRPHIPLVGPPFHPNELQTCYTR